MNSATCSSCSLAPTRWVIPSRCHRVPRDRVDAVRLAMEAMVKDPAFRADAAKRRLDLLPARWDELERTVAEAFQATPAEIAIARKFYKQ